MQTKRFSVADLITVPETVVAVQEMMKGTFADEVARIKAMQADLDKQIAASNSVIVEATAKAKQIVADAEQAAAQVHAVANTALSDAKEKLAAAEPGAAKLASDQSVFESYKNAQVYLLKQRTVALDAREATLKRGEGLLKDAQAKLDGDRAKVNERLEALKIG